MCRGMEQNYIIAPIQITCAINHAAFFIGTWIALGRHHNGHCRGIIPAERQVAKRAIQCCLHGGNQIRPQAWQNDRFRVAKAAVELYDLWAGFSQHQPDIQNAAIGVPSSAMPLARGRTISSITCCCSSSVRRGAGEMAPIPPVLGPSSPS